MRQPVRWTLERGDADVKYAWRPALRSRYARALRALALDIDQLDQFAADRFGVNRTDLRGSELLGASRTTRPTALAAVLHVVRRG